VVVARGSRLARYAECINLRFRYPPAFGVLLATLAGPFEGFGDATESPHTDPALDPLGVCCSFSARRSSRAMLAMIFASSSSSGHRTTALTGALPDLFDSGPVTEIPSSRAIDIIIAFS
jgi:hypothetical protein